jgi:L-galactono-1,4-lactone dehydrogenase
MRRFRDYARMMEDGVMAKHGAVEHWAKIEVPSRTTDLMLIRERLSARYPLERFTAVRCDLRS